jgi:hypothetical protein
VVAVSSALANIALGLITTVVGGAAVWLWQHLAVRRSRRAKESFFGLARGTGCLIIFNNAAVRRGAMHHNDVQAMIEVATLAASTGSPVSVESATTSGRERQPHRVLPRRRAADPARVPAPGRSATRRAPGWYPAADLRNRRAALLLPPGSEIRAGRQVHPDARPDRSSSSAA